MWRRSQVVGARRHRSPDRVRGWAVGAVTCGVHVAADQLQVEDWPPGASPYLRQRACPGPLHVYVLPLDVPVAPCGEQNAPGVTDLLAGFRTDADGRRVVDAVRLAAVTVFVRVLVFVWVTVMVLVTTSVTVVVCVTVGVNSTGAEAGTSPPLHDANTTTPSTNDPTLAHTVDFRT